MEIERRHRVTRRLHHDIHVAWAGRTKALVWRGPWSVVGGPDPESLPGHSRGPYCSVYVCLSLSMCHRRAASILCGNSSLFSTCQTCIKPSLVLADGSRHQNTIHLALGPNADPHVGNQQTYGHSSILLLTLGIFYSFVLSSHLLPYLSEVGADKTCRPPFCVLCTPCTQYR